MLQAEGGRLFDNSHISPDRPLTNMLPTTADFVNLFRGIRATCVGWEVKQDGELKIFRRSKINQPSKERGTEYRFSDKTACGGDPEKTVKAHLSEKNLQVKHVRFILIGNQNAINPENGSKFAGALGVILVTMSDNVYNKSCLWHKTGMYYSTDYETEFLDHDIIVRT